MPRAATSRALFTLSPLPLRPYPSPTSQSEQQRSKQPLAVPIVDHNTIEDDPELFPPGQPRLWDYVPRNRHRKRLKDGSGPVWPDDLERVLFKGIYVFYRKFCDSWTNFSRAKARNRWLGEYVHAVAGVKRDRKQVASRIQELRQNLWGSPLFYLVAQPRELQAMKTAGLAAPHEASFSAADPLDDDDASSTTQDTPAIGEDLKYPSSPSLSSHSLLSHSLSSHSLPIDASISSASSSSASFFSCSAPSSPRTPDSELGDFFSEAAARATTTSTATTTSATPAAITTPTALKQEYDDVELDWPAGGYWTFDESPVLSSMMEIQKAKPAVFHQPMHPSHASAPAPTSYPYHHPCDLASYPPTSPFHSLDLVHHQAAAVTTAPAAAAAGTAVSSTSASASSTPVPHAPSHSESRVPRSAAVAPHLVPLFADPTIATNTATTTASLARDCNYLGSDSRELWGTANLGQSHPHGGAMLTLPFSTWPGATVPYTSSSSLDSWSALPTTRS